MNRYDVDGKAHRMLSRIARGPATRAELMADGDPGRGARHRRKLQFVFLALKDDGLVERIEGQGYRISRKGEEVLEALQQGTAVEIAHDRIWLSRRAA
jgi:uncharacterized protein YjhX (UPF0386 family)